MKPTREQIAQRAQKIMAQWEVESPLAAWTLSVIKAELMDKAWAQARAELDAQPKARRAGRPGWTATEFDTHLSEARAASGRTTDSEVAKHFRNLSGEKGMDATASVSFPRNPTISADASDCQG